MDGEHDGIQCVVANVTLLQTECVCRYVNASNPVAAAGRRLQSSSASETASRTILQVSSIAQYVYSEFTSVMASSSSFNSAQALQASMLVIETFAGLWFGMGFLLILSEYSRRLYKSYKARRHEKSAAIAVKDASQDDSKNLEDLMHEYLGSFYPSVFSNEPRMHRFFHELFRNHKLFKVLYLTHGAEQMVIALDLLTNLTAAMFLLAVFYNIQFRNDDGSCQQNTTEQSCLGKKSPMNPSVSVCGWAPVGGAHVQPAPVDSEYRCVWIKPSFDAASLILISLFVVVLSSPVNFILSVIFDKILLGPTPREIDDNEKVVNRRRHSVMSQVQAHTDVPSLQNTKHVNRDTVNAAASRNTIFSNAKTVKSELAVLSSQAHKTAMRTATIIVSRRSYPLFTTRSVLDFTLCRNFAWKIHIFAS
jgi:hypothetical protein